MIATLAAVGVSIYFKVDLVLAVGLTYLINVQVWCLYKAFSIAYGTKDPSSIPKDKRIHLKLYQLWLGINYSLLLMYIWYPKVGLLFPSLAILFFVVLVFRNLYKLRNLDVFQDNNKVKIYLNFISFRAAVWLSFMSLLLLVLIYQFAYKSGFYVIIGSIENFFPYFLFILALFFLFAVTAFRKKSHQANSSKLGSIK